MSHLWRRPGCGPVSGLHGFLCLSATGLAFQAATYLGFGAMVYGALPQTPGLPASLIGYKHRSSPPPPFPLPLSVHPNFKVKFWGSSRIPCSCYDRDLRGASSYQGLRAFKNMVCV